MTRQRDAAGRCNRCKAMRAGSKSKSSCVRDDGCLARGTTRASLGEAAARPPRTQAQLEQAAVERLQAAIADREWWRTGPREPQASAAGEPITIAAPPPPAPSSSSSSAPPPLPSSSSAALPVATTAGAGAAGGASIEERVEAALSERKTELITDAAKHNKNLTVAPPLVAAIINATMDHARRRALDHARRRALAAAAGPLPRRTGLTSVVFDTPTSEGPPNIDEYMVAGTELLFADWRDVGISSFECATCGGSMRVATHEAEPDGIKRDAFKCTTKGQLGITRLVKPGARCFVVAPELKCSSCSHTCPMHAAEILKQVPPRLRRAYPVDPAYATTTTIHFGKEVTRQAEALFEESPTALATIVSALDESLALAFEDAMEDYHDDLLDHLASLEPEARAIELTTSPPIDESMRKQLFGVAPSEGALSDRVEKKLEAESSERTEELRSIAPPPGGLTHMCIDDNDPLAKGAQVSGKHDKRKLMLTASAQTGQVLSAVLIPDASFKSKERAVRDLKEQFGEPRILSLDNLPVNAADYSRLLPSTQLVNDLKHFFCRLKNTSNSYSEHHAEQIKKLADAFMLTRRTGKHSIESITRKLRGLDGGIKPGGSVMIERGRGKTKARFFVFDDEENAIMPEETIERILKNGCFEETFKSNLHRDWRSVDEIRASLLDLRGKISHATETIAQVRTAIREQAKQALCGTADERPLAIAHAVADAAEAAKVAALITLDQDAVEGEAIESIEAAAVGAADAACSALVAQSTELTAPTQRLLADERQELREALEQMSSTSSSGGIMALLGEIGVSFTANNALTYTWSTATLPALDLALSKLQWLDRPTDVPRYIADGVDARGLETFRVMDGTNMAEVAFGELEKTISANGGYNETKWHGLLLSKIGRMNERKRTASHGIAGPGHYDLARARAHNAKLEALGLPPPHPHLPPLAPRSKALYGIDYFHAELERRRAPPAAAPPPPPALQLTATTTAASGSLPLAAAPATGEVEARVETGVETGGLTGGVTGGAVKVAPPLTASGDLFGIVPGMVTYGKGWVAQVGHDLKHKPVCKPSCPGYKSKRTCAVGCEQRIIREAKRQRKVR
jgi:hypothetical protein